MIKRVILILLALVGLYGAVLSPYSLTSALEKKSNLEQALISKTQATDSRDRARTNFTNARNAFDSQRSFQIGYSELGKLKQLIDQVSGVSFHSISEVDPKNGYILMGPLNIEDYTAEDSIPPAAVQMTIYAEDSAACLSVIETMELPVVSLIVEEPGQIIVTFLTGGES